MIYVPKRNSSVIIEKRIFFPTTLLTHNCEKERQFVVDFYHLAFIDDK